MGSTPTSLFHRDTPQRSAELESEIQASRSRASQRPTLSIVVPAYNEEDRISTSLPALSDLVRRHPTTELIVVDDGSEDLTAERVARALRDTPRCMLIRLPWNHGKGAAVRAGVAAATGEVIVFADADLAASLDDLPKLVAALEEADIAVGSRSAPGASVTGGCLARRIASVTFALATRRLLRLPHRDTQCGFKAFRASTAKVLFQLVRCEGFAFDVEVLALARLLGYRVAEVPIRWHAVEGSRVRLPRDAITMVRDLLAVRRRCIKAARRARALAPQHFEEGLLDQFTWRTPRPHDRASGVSTAEPRPGELHSTVPRKDARATGVGQVVDPVIDLRPVELDAAGSKGA
ncbi:MAG: hypothetical protein KatS3mg008_0776 [Acidimicrobiales bacterium]|nr:MAG: hypothetical protein KatS3mg008_0776 [Acidimicrobiales bacterium]